MVTFIKLSPPSVRRAEGLERMSDSCAAGSVYNSVQQAGRQAVQLNVGIRLAFRRLQSE